MARADPGRVPALPDAAARQEIAVYRERARRLGLSFALDVDLGPANAPNIAAIDRASFAVAAVGDRRAFLAPEEDDMASALHWLARYPGARERLVVSTPSAIRAALLRAGSAGLVRDAVEHLARVQPEFSARHVITRRQLAAGLVFALLTAAAFAVNPFIALGVFDLVGALFFFGVSALRFIAAAAPLREDPPVPLIPDEDLPVYSVLVPLRDEAAMVPGLVKVLGDLDWPVEKLDIKVIVEEDDLATVAAARTHACAPPFEVVVVPAVRPRTKPKALDFALSLARGEFVTVYDAEDRPHPDQLRVAHAAFMDGDEGLACVQASLVIDNPKAGWLARLFAIEYAALFDGLLPMLVSHNLPLPLGGSSNHFRRAALDDVGGWDPFNVTEDADLGFRLARFGYRTATISVPTLEEAPKKFRPWFRQRTRWFKGWMQTWLVHTRQPRRLYRELGLGGFVGFNLVGTGIIVSALVYPVYLFTVLVLINDPLNLWGNGTVFEATLLGLNAFNLVAGYVSMSLLAGRALRARGRAREAIGLVLLPLYWLLMSFASYRAVLELILRPHHWHKTPHTRPGV